MKSNDNVIIEPIDANINVIADILEEEYFSKIRNFDNLNFIDKLFHEAHENVYLGYNIYKSEFLQRNPYCFDTYLNTMRKSKTISDGDEAYSKENNLFLSPKEFIDAIIEKNEKCLDKNRSAGVTFLHNDVYYKCHKISDRINELKSIALLKSISLKDIHEPIIIEGITEIKFNKNRKAFIVSSMDGSNKIFKKLVAPSDIIAIPKENASVEEINKLGIVTYDQLDKINEIIDYNSHNYGRKLSVEKALCKEYVSHFQNKYIDFIEDISEGMLDIAAKHTVEVLSGKGIGSPQELAEKASRLLPSSKYYMDDYLKIAETSWNKSKQYAR